MSTLSLAGDWQLHDEKREYLLDMAIPGDVINALYNASLIPDPYAACNEHDLRWIAEREWHIERDFYIDSQSLDSGWVLYISELDTVAEVYVNDQCVLEAENQFRRYQVNVSTFLQSGSNRIQIRFLSNPRQALLKQREQPWPVPWHKENSPIPHGNMLRKVQCDFGWDWNIALAPFGLHGQCRLEQRQRLSIDTVSIDQALNEDFTEAMLSVRIRIVSSEPLPLDCAIKVSIADQEQMLSVGTDGIAQGSLVINDPDLWWPVGLGEQALYLLTLTVDGHKQQRQIGFRRIELITTNPDDPDDTPFFIRVNGQPVFCRGANWIPADALPGRITEAKTRALLQSAVDANMNMLRVWGGGRYEPDSFYQACDELGLMLWQDFMFSCNLYPSTPEFLEEVGKEVDDVVERLHHHACLALWCGDNELVGALNWFQESIDNRDRYLVAYDRLNRTVESRLKASCPSANWWPSSPCSGYMDYGDAWHDDSRGDMHFWSVWHEGRDFEHYRDIHPRFCSEFGFQSYPSMSVIRQFASAEDLNIASPVLECHQKNAGGNARIAETMFRYFRFPVGFENFVYLSQVQQALAMQTAVDYWRGLKPHCMGALYWQLNDTWPVASWSSLDYGGNWKLLHHLAQRFFAPVRASVRPQADCLQLRLVNDQSSVANVVLEVAAVDMAGQWRSLESVNVQVSNEKAVTALEIPIEMISHDEILGYRWKTDQGSWSVEHYTLQPYKALPLRDPALKMDAQADGEGGWKIAITSQSLALYVALECNLEGRFSDNGFTVLPNDNSSVTFQPALAESVEAVSPVFTLHDLYSATCRVV
ncbi:MAG: glycoside hydrolase family 2 protein [Granulosicoccus sp.]